MPLQEILALAPKIKVLATPDAILYLWATSPLLREALAVIEAWGFTYKTSMVWMKDLMGLGCWARQRHELLLIAARGRPVPPDENDRPDSVILAPRREHSEKPGEVAERHCQLEPTGGRVCG